MASKCTDKYQNFHENVNNILTHYIRPMNFRMVYMEVGYQKNGDLSSIYTKSP